LIFDFDIEEKKCPCKGSYDFVSSNFQKDIERCIKDTFRLYYRDVDTSKFFFVWLETPHKHKYSRHLIVNNAIFCSDWVVQSQTFYSLFKLIAYRSGLFSYIDISRLVDTQVARNNATFRMCWCSKIDGPIMLPQDKSVSIYQTLVQIYRKEEAKTEQRIMDSQLKIDIVLLLTEGIEEYNIIERTILRNIPQLKKSIEEMEKPDRADLGLTESCLECIDKLGNCYEIRSVEEGMIILNRKESGECPISGKLHDSEGGFIKVTIEGDAYFYCFRKCLNDFGRSGLCLKKGVSMERSKEDSVKAILGTSLATKVLLNKKLKPELSNKQIAGFKKREENLRVKSIGMKLEMPDISLRSNN
jgi:hypothetical protein